jgi:hypothetical protein
MAPVKRLGGDAALTEPGRGTLAEFLPPLADHDDGLAGKSRRPVGQILVQASRGTGDQTWIGGEILIDTHINQRRRLNGTDEPGKFLG